MIHPMFRLLLSEPQLIADHVEAYTDLVSEEIGAVTGHWKRRALLMAVSAGSFVIFLVTACVALMLWGAASGQSMNAPWLLFVVPGVFLLIGVGSLLTARAPVQEHGLAAIRDQLAADAAMLRSVSAP